MLEDWLLHDDEVAVVGCQLKTGGGDDGFTDPFDAIVGGLVTVCTGATDWTIHKPQHSTLHALNIVKVVYDK